MDDVESSAQNGIVTELLLYFPNPKWMFKMTPESVIAPENIAVLYDGSITSEGLKLLVMSRETAVTLYKNLGEAIALAAAPEVLKAPKTTRGYINREATITFLEQMRTVEVARRQAGTFHGLITRAVSFGKLPQLKVRCGKCHRDIDAPSCLKPLDLQATHRGTQERRLLEIRADDLKKLTVPEFREGIIRSGREAENILELLQKALV